jgi:23S rRNA (cytidine1920-2'-O)/16S rRNA (cytidine1409-2'-O)-methyltransferase
MSSKPRRVRLDRLLVERGLLPDLKTAGAWIMAGKVRVGDRYGAKAGELVPAESALEVKGLEQRFVSRGGEKLESALARFSVAVEGRVALDAGASTGGFTDCLLQRGARRVYAVDVGFGQIRGSLTRDPRVTSLERTNISDLDRGHFAEPLDLCVADLSYLSVVDSLPILAGFFERPPLILHLIKPLFEGVPDTQASDLGRIARIFPGIDGAARNAGLVLCELRASPILGSSGTVEFFGLFRGAPQSSPGVERLSADALDEAATLLRDAI